MFKLSIINRRMGCFFFHLYSKAKDAIDFYTFNSTLQTGETFEKSSFLFKANEGEKGEK